MTDRGRRVGRGLRAAALVIGLFLPYAATPLSAAETPAAFIAALNDRVIGVINGTRGELERRRDELKLVFIEEFDIAHIAQFMLGRWWAKAGPEKQDEFMKVLPGYVATIYASQFVGYEGSGFKISKEKPKNGDTVVEGTIEQIDKPAIKASFTVTQRDGRYLIKNATVEGVSLLDTKREEFAPILKREGVDGLIVRLREVMARLE